MLYKRIQILEDAGVISKEVQIFMYEVIEFLKEENMQPSLMEMFTTHLAMATQRMLENQDIEEVDDGVWCEVCTIPSYQKACKLCDELLQFAPCQFPENEQRFLIMHLCNLLQ